MERKRHVGRKKKRTHRKPTTCHQCGEHFDTQAACMKHHLTMHPRTSFCPPQERHICEICGASLAPGSVATHINMHTRAKVHTCETCGRAFHSSVGLKRHMVTHTGEKPFACSLCDKRFTQSNSMKLHYKTFHLKQPYPKRRKNKDDLLDGQEKSSEDESSSSMPLLRRAPEDVHYLALS
ncbi:zinc finger protein 596-like isoform X2 [Hyposmocoma kahamanoa]|uniref:zinc finger protein 596-like isoform X2 n=1 Tax=Hyposmocoma kahamanoa TaxID=1477025 RepID=UPI000E6D8614|nr:zinc finger protein 596-like isoform X2 [Hyposmocoma kahamanoa]